LLGLSAQKAFFSRTALCGIGESIRIEGAAVVTTAVLASGKKVSVILFGTGTVFSSISP